MNRLTGSSTCRICRHWLEAGTTGAMTREQLDDITRQVANGMCDGCQRKRQAAAVRYIRAADKARLINQIAIAAGWTIDMLPEAYTAAVRDAERQCEELMMWPPRRHGSPDRFRKQ